MDAQGKRGDEQPTGKPRVRGFSLGPFETNCYIVTPSAGGSVGACWVIDPGFEPGRVIALLRSEGLRPEAILLTHAHLDHIAGVPEVLVAFPGTPVLIHEAEKEWPANPTLNLSAGYGFPVRAPAPTGTLQDDQTLTLGGDAWQVLHTPGHSPGGITLYHAPSSAAVVGDTLFAGSIGRSDFPGSDSDTLLRSIRTRLYTLPGETVIYPGHGGESTIGRERLSNPFVRAE